MQHVECKLCGGKTHVIATHLKREHADVTLEDYKAKFPGEPLMSEAALAELAKRQAAKVVAVEADSLYDRTLQDAFGLDKSDKSALNSRGGQIVIHVLERGASAEMIPDVDPNYVFTGSILRNAIMAYELNLPLYVYGHAGTGKTELLTQICARTNRPMIRVQHTANTEESHIVGQWTARGGETIFELGPLAVAMKEGWVYLADEYDFALPSVLAVYQPVLEGKPLVIKEADAANRIVRPHPNFRFVATGNTNGTGDESGLYQGTNIQNAANYDRFHMVIEMQYLSRELEQQILVKRAGIAGKDAESMVDFASRVRDQFTNSKISSPISPRTLIAASRIGMMKANYREGLQLCFTNKLSRVDKEAVDSLAKRIFG